MEFGGRVGAWLRCRPSLVDGLVAVVVLLPDLLLLLPNRPGRLVFPVLLTAPLVIRRRSPVWCLALVLAVALGQWLAVPEQVLFIADLAVPVAVHAAAAHGSRLAGRLALTAGLAGAALGALTWPVFPTATPGEHALFGASLAAAVLAAWALGSLQRVRLERIAALIERARLLEIERDQAALLAVAAERRRIAREMHDVVSHSLAVMIAQADGGWYAAPSSPQTARDSLATIGSTGRQAVEEMGRLLGVLRDGPSRTDQLDAGAADLTGGARDSAPAGGPLPGIGDLGGLVEQARAGGLDVRMFCQPRDLLHGEAVDGGIGLVIYRIVQEGLTNVMKHAGPAARVEVVVRRTAAHLEVEVLDDGGASPGAGPGSGRHGGFGVLGMRERAAAYGGTVAVGPWPGGGYAVQARIPVVSAS